ncbi:transcriptional regulator [Pseudarthrobacter phenanthrenivorans Sphe3]|uniref:Transcriptional regulator n=1 Tax=Pseudarthrobacter phenanthrenivorans (strain DSM 18606 / JCM 16027 / LMG 23796 / Sphe3) TaxID=930171 RepID=F0M3L8_PSEPM|nr:GntR family transcriptional regulator [Pseudarthrobacter phenanthrenivorans]ADX72237.1 transcriptional regulator [Pseudarthrobacter phenanthrenivorans Sphe3]
MYSRIAETIRNGLLTPGSMIPTETELGTDMKVSRTVVREALMLLEEDGLIRAWRGVGRFVSDTLPRIGIERIQPFEDVLGSPGQQAEVKRCQPTISCATGPNASDMAASSVNPAIPKSQLAAVGVGAGF